MRAFIRCFLLLALALPLAANAARSSEPFNKVEPRVVSAVPGKELKAEDVRKGFLIAATRLGYVVTPQEDGSLQVRLIVRTHVLDFKVTFNDTGYVTEYQSSENLGFEDGDPAIIHPKVRQWLDKLYKTAALEVLRM